MPATAKLTTATHLTYRVGAVAWTRGPLETPGRCITALNFFTTTTEATDFASGLEAGREPAIAELELNLSIGGAVRVSAYGRARAGVVDGFTSTGRVRVTAQRNAAGETFTRDYPVTEVYPPTDDVEAVLVVAVRERAATAALEADELEETVAEAAKAAALTAPTDELEERLAELDTAHPAETTDEQADEAEAIAAELERRRSAQRADKLPTRADAGRMTDPQLEATIEELEARRDAIDYDATDEAGEELDARLLAALGALEDEQQARAEWQHGDARVREAAGNYRP